MREEAYIDSRIHELLSFGSLWERQENTKFSLFSFSPSSNFGYTLFTNCHGSHMFWRKKSQIKKKIFICRVQCTPNDPFLNSSYKRSSRIQMPRWCFDPVEQASMYRNGFRERHSVALQQLNYTAPFVIAQVLNPNAIRHGTINSLLFFSSELKAICSRAGQLWD